jgi:hypothetical protein
MMIFDVFSSEDFFSRAKFCAFVRFTGEPQRDKRKAGIKFQAWEVKIQPDCTSSVITKGLAAKYDVVILHLPIAVSAKSQGTARLCAVNFPPESREAGNLFMVEFEDQIGLAKASEVSRSVGAQRSDEDAFLCLGKSLGKCEHGVGCVGPTPMPPREPVLAANPAAVMFGGLLIFVF